jgi:hypothetical protein
MATSSIGIVKQWAYLAALPSGKAELKALWAKSGHPQATDWDAGAVYLVALLLPLAQPGQQIDKIFVQGLSPCTVAELGQELGW